MSQIISALCHNPPKTSHPILLRVMTVFTMTYKLVPSHDHSNILSYHFSSTTMLISSSSQKSGDMFQTQDSVLEFFLLKYPFSINQHSYLFQGFALKKISTRPSLTILLKIVPLSKLNIFISFLFFSIAFVTT